MHYGTNISLSRPQLGRVVWPALALMAAGGMSVVYFLDPRVAGNYPPCLFLYFTGCYCPGCGTLRALHRVLNGDLPGALGYNPLTVLILPILVVLGIDGVARSFGWRILPIFEVPHRLAWAALAVILLFWVLRNVPAFPLKALAP